MCVYYCNADRRFSLFMFSYRCTYTIQLYSTIQCIVHNPWILHTSYYYASCSHSWLLLMILRQLFPLDRPTSWSNRDSMSKSYCSEFFVDWQKKMTFFSCYPFWTLFSAIEHQDRINISHVMRNCAHHHMYSGNHWSLLFLMHFFFFLTKLP